MIVITLTKVPPALRGDLTKWCQEIQTGVYVGNVMARVREKLWERIMRNIGNGEATLTYSTNNELGYTFRTTRKDYQVVDFDGIPLMKHVKEQKGSAKHGFSKAAKQHQARIMLRQKSRAKSVKKITDFVVIDIETNGLDPQKNELIEIGAVKKTNQGEVVTFERLIKSTTQLPPAITQLTGITTEELQVRGVPIVDALVALREFVEDRCLVGYNINFDRQFLTIAFERSQQLVLSNTFFDLMPRVKREQRFLDNYRLSTVLATYEIKNSSSHRALSDAQAIFELLSKLIKNGIM